MNIGAEGLFQDLVKINMAVEKGTLGEEKTLVEAFDYAKKNQRAIHYWFGIRWGCTFSFKSSQRIN